MGHSPAMRTLARNDVCLMPAACLTSCPVPREKVEESVARLVLSKLSLFPLQAFFFFFSPFSLRLLEPPKTGFWDFVSWLYGALKAL